MINLSTSSFGKIISVSEIRKNIKHIPKVGGVYKHYIDIEGLKYLDDVHPTTKEIAEDGAIVYLLYIGKATNLFDRFKWHLGMSNTSPKQIYVGRLSTLRLSYMANHRTIQCLSEQELLNKFMDKHTYAQYMETEDFDLVEKQLINENDLPLNVKHNTQHPFASINSARRSAISNKFKDENSHYMTNIKNTNSNQRKCRISDVELNEYAKQATMEGINNKSRFIKWFREKNLSASEERLGSAWKKRVR
ncbi:MAG: hypothetical protein L0Y61_09465 [Epsilonproteobacteria bacterium]|nr:hypothetical protein [Campylobacterota bacterium]